MPDRYLQDEQERRQNAVDIAVLKEQVRHQNEALASIAKTVDGMAEKLESVSQTLTEAKGGWRMLMLVGGAAGSVGAAMTWIASHISIKGTP